jgi:hypothetical protein
MIVVIDNLNIDPTLNTPKISTDYAIGIIKITGRSIPEHPHSFYHPLQNWLEQFIATNPSTIHFFLFLDYMNTHSHECLYNIFKLAEAYCLENNKPFTIEWLYDEDDEDLLEIGEDFESMVKADFKFVPKTID